MSDLDPGAYPASPPALLSYGRHAPDDPGPLGPSPHLHTVESETRHYRRDGRTPAARAAFLETLARSGIVTDACKGVGLSSQACSLRNRDPCSPPAGMPPSRWLARASPTNCFTAR